MAFEREMWLNEVEGAVARAKKALEVQIQAPVVEEDAFVAMPEWKAISKVVLERQNSAIISAKVSVDSYHNHTKQYVAALESAIAKYKKLVLGVDGRAEKVRDEMAALMAAGWRPDERRPELFFRPWESPLISGLLRFRGELQLPVSYPNNNFDFHGGMVGLDDEVVKSPYVPAHFYARGHRIPICVGAKSTLYAQLLQKGEYATVADLFIRMMELDPAPDALPYSRPSTYLSVVRCTNAKCWLYYSQEMYGPQCPNCGGTYWEALWPGNKKALVEDHNFADGDTVLGVREKRALWLEQQKAKAAKAQAMKDKWWTLFVGAWGDAGENPATVRPVNYVMTDEARDAGVRCCDCGNQPPNKVKVNRYGHVACGKHSGLNYCEHLLEDGEFCMIWTRSGNLRCIEHGGNR